MDRIFDRPLSLGIRETWLNLIPKVFRLAELEQNPSTVEFLGGIENYSEGKFMLVNCTPFVCVWDGGGGGGYSLRFLFESPAATVSDRHRSANCIWSNSLLY